MQVGNTSGDKESSADGYSEFYENLNQFLSKLRTAICTPTGAGISHALRETRTQLFSKHCRELYGIDIWRFGGACEWRVQT